MNAAVCKNVTLCVPVVQTERETEKAEAQWRIKVFVQPMRDPAQTGAQRSDGSTVVLFAAIHPPHMLETTHSSSPALLQPPFFQGVKVVRLLTISKEEDEILGLVLIEILQHQSVPQCPLGPCVPKLGIFLLLCVLKINKSRL